MFDSSQLHSLADVLASLDRGTVDRPEEDILKVLEDYDYSFKETLKNRLEATPGSPGSMKKIWAKMPFGGRHVYKLQSEDREVDLHFKEGFGGGIAHYAHRVYELIESNRRSGKIDYFPNNGFIFTNKELCTGISLIRFGAESYILYRGDTSRSLMKSKYYSVTTTPDGRLVAIIVEAGGWFLSQRRMKVFENIPDITIALLMAVHHGLVFRNS